VLIEILIGALAAKYKEYGRLKALESSLSRRENRPHELSESQSKKRKHASPPGQDVYQHSTPRKSSKSLFATPSNPRTRNHPAQVDPYDSPSTLRRLFSPTTHKQEQPAPSPLKAAIGPTPQRDGKTLGLFDMLSESGGSRGTPSAKRQTNNLAAAFRTPSKRRPVETIFEVSEEEPGQETPRLARTPASETKQFYLANLFATPTTMRYAAMVEAEDNEETQKDESHGAPQLSPPTAQSGTPSFLRRSNSGRYPPPSTRRDGPGLSPIVSRKPQQFASKGLSHLVQGLRDMEEDRMDDDWDVMREMEEEAEAEEASKMQVEDSQKPDVNRKYKKKGQKRTTRRVIMRPVMHQPKPKAALSDVNDSGSDDELAAVPETQQAPAVDDGWDDVPSDIERAEDAASLHTMSEPELDTEAEFDADSEDDPEFGGKSQPAAKPRSFSERIKEAVSLSAAKSKEQAPLGKPPKTIEATEKKPRARKVNAQAHANYRSLSINRGGGSSRGRGGRFRRR
jgi:hypothetical protein